uniref:SHSP domain-containing protein n=2 Tax=Timema TaxID=61471 RepID=A0A7R9EI62_9NEOP|nr:unnamed protein product [Timema cristinae]CAD7434466.1 unnamed protein product [Timema monikensis]
MWPVPLRRLRTRVHVQRLPPQYYESSVDADAPPSKRMPLILDSMIGMLNDLHPREVFLDQNFKTSLEHSDPRQVSGSFRAGCYHPWCNQASMDSGVSDLHQNADEFKVTLDVQQFRSDELTVKTVDYYIVIEGKHKENKDQFCIISNEFKRSYLLPNYVDIDHLTSSLSSDGLLTVHAPKKVYNEPPEEKVILVTPNVTETEL